VSRVQRLYQLQSLDSEIDQVREELAEITANLGESVALKAAREAARAAEKRQRQAQTNFRDLDLEVKSLSDKIGSHEKRLYSGKGLSPKEAASLQQEVASLKRWQSQREDRLLEAMVELEEAEEQLTQNQAQLAEVQQAWATNQENLGQAQSALKTRAAALIEQRSRLIRGIDEDDLAEYEELRSRKGGQAVALVKDDICQVCWMGASHSKIQQARAGIELNYCGTCGRILYVL